MRPDKCETYSPVKLKYPANFSVQVVFRYAWIDVTSTFAFARCAAVAVAVAVAAGISILIAAALCSPRFFVGKNAKKVADELHYIASVVGLALRVL